MRIVDNAPWLGSCKYHHLLSFLWILQQWKLDDNIVSHLLKHEHLALLHNNNQKEGGDHLTKRVNDKAGGIIEPEEVLAGVKHCAPGKRKNYKFANHL